MLPTDLFSMLPNTAFSENSEDLKALLKNKSFVPILATSIFGFSLLLIRKNFFKFVTLENNKPEDKKAVNNSEDEQINQTINYQDKRHKILDKDTESEKESGIGNSKDVKLRKDDRNQEEKNKETNFKDKCTKETSVSKDKFCALEKIYKKINFLKILVIFSIWYVFFVF